MNHHDLLGALAGTNPPMPADGNRPASGPGGDGHPECSRKGCRSAAAWRLQWNNPRIHTPDRRKTWLACTEHREWLADYLRTRGLLKDVLPLVPDGQAETGRPTETETTTEIDS